MKEKITDEMLEHFGKSYEEYKRFIEEIGGNVLFTFEQFVDRQLRWREFKIRKALEHIEKEKEKKQT